ncbi:MAG: group I intron-associated PD-(D/E)XK endonuclease [Solirubrobacteraceae bacterium]
MCSASGRRVGEVVLIRSRTSRLTNNGHVRTTYTSKEIDAIAAYCADLDEVYLLPISEVEGKAGLHLRLSPCTEQPDPGC